MQQYMAYEKKAKMYGGVLMADGLCVSTAKFNAAHAYADRQLVLVFGSLGVGLGPNPFFIHGEARYRTVADFVNAPLMRRVEKELGHRAPNSNSMDIHCWLEDAEGRVYDVVTGDMVGAAASQLQRIDLVPWTVIQGAPKSELRRKGLHYVPAPSETQPLLRGMCDRMFGHLDRLHEAALALQRLEPGGWEISQAQFKAMAGC